MEELDLPEDHDPHGAHPLPQAPAWSAVDLEATARLLRSLADEGRLQLLALLVEGEVCVSALATALSLDISTVSQRLRVLSAEGVVKKRRAGKHIHYRLADACIVELLTAAAAHARELRQSP
jgi:DNA-binding transcriptional ArsR family regulator